MATEIDDLRVKISADAKGVKSGTDQATKQLNSFASNASKSFGGVSTKAVAVGNIIAKVFAKAFQAIAASMDSAIQRLDTLKNFPKVMSNLGIGAASSQKAINYLSDKLQGLPTAVDTAAQSVQRFTSANGNVEASTKMFLALNNAILAGGASSETQATALEQLSQAYAKGKPDMMEWRSAMTAMPAQLRQIAQAMGYVDASALGEALRSGKVSMNEFMATVSKMNTQGLNGFKSFEEQARNSTGGIQTSITNLKTAITRGLANIMDAIGQSNIAGFFNGVASAIGTAANYVAAFVRVVLTAINALRAVFGQAPLQFGGTKSAAEDTASAVESIGSAANDAASDIDGATGSAKKLAKQLAGFDEMNVLKEQDSGSGGGGGGGAGGAGGLGGFDFGNLDMGEITDPIQAAYDKLMSLFGDLDLSKWHKALRNFKNGAVKAFAIVKSAASSAWNDMFVPLAKYVAESTLPDYINGIGEAMQRLDPDTWGRGFKNFFSGLETTVEGFLDIIVSVSNTLSGFFAVLGNIVIPPALSILGTTFEIIGNVLKGIGEGFQYVWVEELQPALDQFAQAFQPIIDKIQSVMSAISQCTPLMETFKAIGQAVGIVVGAAFEAVADVIMVVVGAVMIAIDFFIEMGEWVGNVVLNIVDFFTYMGRHSDEVWQGICDFIRKVFTPIGDFFKAVGKSIADTFTGIWNGIKTGAQNAWNGIKSVFSTVASFFQTIFTNAWTAVKNVFSTGGRIFDGIKEGIVSAFKTIVNAIIKGINKVVSIPFNAINNVLSGIRNIDILGAKPFSWIGTINVPQIPLLARGGIVDGATIAMIGEQGREAVVPLENNTGWIEQLAKDIQEQGGTGEPIHVTINLGDETLVDKVIDGVNDQSFLNNRLVFNI